MAGRVFLEILDHFMNLDRASIASVLDYDGVSGDFRWKVSSARKIKIGDIAGSIFRTKTGGIYRKIKLFGKSYLAHRLAWLFVYGNMPSKMIDHIDGNGLNNSILNLRDVSRKVNAQNSKLRIDNSSGHNGIYFHPQRKRWVAYITENKKMKYLGIFENIDDAIARRDAENIKIGFHVNHGKR